MLALKVTFDEACRACGGGVDFGEVAILVGHVLKFARGANFAATSAASTSRGNGPLRPADLLRVFPRKLKPL
jgi:hypothetical protein